MKLEDDYKTEKESGSGTTVGYSVEARCSCREPKKVGDIILHDKWQRIHFNKGFPGVPQPKVHLYELERAGLLGYQTAQALRWWFHAELEREILGGLCIESRLVKHQVEYSYKSTAISQHEIIGGNDRSNSMPDWGKEND